MNLKITALNRVAVLTGFEPFGGFQVNPSWEAAKTFNNKEIASYRVKAFQIPLAYKKIKPAIAAIIDAEKPSIVIGTGQSYRALISLEKVAINHADLTDSALLYNCGTRPKDQTLEPKGPAAYFTTLPIRELLHQLRQHNIPADISYTAGTFGCNQAFFHTMHKIHKDKLGTVAGFVHVPSLPSQAAELQKRGKAGRPSMNLDTMTKALEIAIRTTVRNTQG
jgi:pyroglutamyl-peptidase